MNGFDVVVAAGSLRSSSPVTGVPAPVDRCGVTVDTTFTGVIYRTWLWRGAS